MCSKSSGSANVRLAAVSIAAASIWLQAAAAAMLWFRVTGEVVVRSKETRRLELSRKRVCFLEEVSSKVEGC